MGPTNLDLGYRMCLSHAKLKLFPSRHLQPLPQHTRTASSADVMIVDNVVLEVKHSWDRSQGQKRGYSRVMSVEYMESLAPSPAVTKHTRPLHEPCNLHHTNESTAVQDCASLDCPGLLLGRIV